jgi:hypothetical protein
MRHSCRRALGPGIGSAQRSHVGRNTLRAGGINNFDLSLFKSFQFAEQKKLEFRVEAMNALNHPQFTNAPPKHVVNSPAGRFLNRDFSPTAESAACGCN